MCVCHQLRQGVQEGQRPHAHYESDAAAPRDGHGVVERRGDGTVPAGEREGGGHLRDGWVNVCTGGKKVNGRSLHVRSNSRLC